MRCTYLRKTEDNGRATYMHVCLRVRVADGQILEGCAAQDEYDIDMDPCAHGEELVTFCIQMERRSAHVSFDTTDNEDEPTQEIEWLPTK